jgi:predicted dehydrogenase
MKIGVVGCGAIGSRYVEWLNELGHDVAAADSDARRLAPLAHSASGGCHTALHQLLAWGPERVVIATPPQHHEAIALAVLLSGADVLIEKPLAHSVAAGRRIAAAATRGRAFVVCNMRFHVGVDAVRRHLAMVGRPLCFRSVFGHRLSQMRIAGGEFARAAEAGGGVVMDCIHEIDYLRWLFGPVRRLRSFVARVGDEVLDAEDLAEIVLEFDSGVVGALHFDFLMRQKRRGLEVIGSDGTLAWLSLGKAPERCSVRFSTNAESVTLLELPDVSGKHEYTEMLRHFIAGGEGVLQTVGEALTALELALAARAGT